MNPWAVMLNSGRVGCYILTCNYWDVPSANWYYSVNVSYPASGFGCNFVRPTSNIFRGVIGMRSQIIIVAGVVALLASGCGTQQVSRYSALGQLSTSNLNTFKQELNNASIKNVELPTKLPFNVIHVSVTSPQRNSAPPGPQNVLIQYSGNNKQLQINIFTHTTTSTVGLHDVKTPTLNNGTKAMYGNNGTSSFLVWDQGENDYTISLFSQGKPEIASEKVLVGIANSFK